MKTIFKFVPLMAVLLAIGCVSSYQPRTRHTGFGETQVAPDTYRIDFVGEVQTPQLQVQDFCSLRTAEVTIQNGFAYFVELERRDMPNVAGNFPQTQILIKCFKAKPGAGNVMDAAFLQQSIRTKYKLK